MGFDGALNMAQFGMPNMGMPPPMEQMYGMNNQGSVSEATIKKEVKDAIKKQLKKENKKRKKEEKEEEK